MQNKLHLAFAAVLLSSTSLTGAYAQDSSPVTTTEEVTVYATRSAESTYSVPAMVDVVDMDDVQNSNVNDLNDVLRYVPGVEVTDGPRRSSQRINIRGFGDSQILTLIDGRRQNMSTGHDGRFFLDPSLLKSVEVIKGTSVTYGSGAMGGVVAMETIDAADMLDPGDNFGAMTSVGYASADRNKTASATAYGRMSGWDLVTSVNYRDAGSIEQGNGEKLVSNDEVASLLLKAGYTFADFHTVKFSSNIQDQDTVEPSNSASTGTPDDKDISSKEFSLKYEFDNPDNNWLKPKVHVYNTATKIEEEDIEGADIGLISTREFDTFGITLDNLSVLSLEGSDHTFAYGVEYYKDEQKGYLSTGAEYGGVPNAEAENIGFYLQDEIVGYVGDGKFTITPAVRYDSYESNNQLGDSQDEDAWSPKFSIAVEPTKNFLFFTSLSKAFRAPGFNEAYANGLHFNGVPFVFPDNNFIANPDLKPEKVTTFEVGGGLNFENVLASKDKISVKGSYFRSKGKDYIDLDVDIAAGTTQSTNVEDASISGWEIQADYAIDNVTTFVGLSKSKAIETDTRDYLNSSMPLTLVAGMTYDMASIDSSFGFRAKAAEENRQVSSGNETTDGYGVLDIFYRWTPEFADENLIVDFGINNVTDKAYTPNYATLYEEGRSVIGKVTYKW